MDLSAATAINLDAIPDAGARQAIRALLNLVEELAAENRALREENQQLRDEIARLKGEQGKPTIKPNTPRPAATDYSSERERRQPKAWHKDRKLDRLTVTRTERLAVDRAQLPPDAQYKGTEAVIVQDLKLELDTIRFEKEIWYSPSQGRSYRAAVPAGYEGEFGPGIKALALALYYGANVSMPKLHELFDHVGVVLSSGYLATLLSQDRADFAAEARAVAQAGRASSPYQHLDDTSTRLDGVTWHCHVTGNPLYTAYHTTPKKDRLTVIDVLRGGDPRRFVWNAAAATYLEWAQVSGTVWRQVARFPRDQELDEAAVERLLDDGGHLGPQQRTRVLEALALGAYQVQRDWPVVPCLVCDDAPQFRAVTAELALCWVHEGRHYTKLTPYVPLHQQLLDDFRQEFWAYYRELQAYREQPTPAERARLEARFDALFATRTGYLALDDRIALTRAKKPGLLLVLVHPELPLHNNPAELAARRRVRKRDVSFGPRSAAGLRAWDTFHTLAATTQQLGVSFAAYLKDRLSQAGQVPSLAELLTERARGLNLGASWAPS
jgi:Transposase IS66 family